MYRNIRCSFITNKMLIAADTKTGLLFLAPFCRYNLEPVLSVSQNECHAPNGRLSRNPLTKFYINFQSVQ
jgi:phage FluMu protein Com